MNKLFTSLIIVLTIQMIFDPLSSITINEGLKRNPIHYLSITIDGDPTDWPKLPPLHPPVSIDGYISDWYTEYYWRSEDRITRDVVTNYSKGIHVFNVSGDNKFLYYKGEFVWFDALNDTRLDVSFADLTEMRVTSNETHLLMLVRVRGKIPVGIVGQNSLLLSILIDTDMNWFNGNYTTIDKYINVSIYAPWDYQVILDLANPNIVNLKRLCGSPLIDIRNSEYASVSTLNSCFAVNGEKGVVELAIYWRDIGVEKPWNVSNVRLYLLTFIGNGTGVPVNVGDGSAVIDVISNYDTATEVSDNVIDYWLDIGFNTVPEPVSYNFYVLDRYGLTLAWSDLSNDQRTDYVPEESFDLDILTFYLHFDLINNRLYFLIHLKGNAGVDRRISPIIAIAIDDTPTNCTDNQNYRSSFDMPGYNTETELGTPIGMDTSRSCNWFRLIWIFSTNSTGDITYWVAVYGLYILYNDTSVTANYHFIEGYVPLDVIDPYLYEKIFRVEVATFAYTLTWVDNQEPYKVLDIPGPNLYDCIAPYPTWGNGTVVIDNKVYATYGEVYYDEYWIDAFNTNKYVVNLDVKLYHVSYDGDQYIELGEYVWVEANLTTFNYATREYKPLPNRTLKVYFVSIDYSRGYYVGSNTTDEFGYFYLYVGELADKIPSGTYRLLVVYEPVGNDQLIYPRVEFWSSETYNVVNRPFMVSVNEPIYVPLIALISILVILLLKRYYDNHS
ncbi:MAG: hypothetical protein QXX10_02925 [Desulfurococcaceae archaeon]